MSGGGLDAWADVVRAVELLATDPHGLGGVRLRARYGPRLRRVLGWIEAVVPARRMPAHITDDRLLGGLSLAATLASGKLVTERGLLARADGGVVIVPMAERLAANACAHLCAAIDHGEVIVERDAVTARERARIGVVALDEGVDDEAAPGALADRLALHLSLDRLVLHPSLDGLPVHRRGPDPPSAERVRAARERLDEVTIAPEALEAITTGAWALGVTSLRAPVLAAAVARANAALEGRGEVDEEDLALAARLVLGPRATRRPGSELEPEQQPEPEQPPPGEAPEGEERDAAEQETPLGSLEEIVLEAARSGLVDGLLDELLVGPAARGGRSAGESGVVGASAVGGRPVGTLAGAPERGQRLHVVDTLRAAAPWQRVRGRELDGRVQVRPADFRVRRFEQRTETTVIFVVDASGSSALQRLAEAKGAVLQVLADCYVRRDHVALIAFRGEGASRLLPPTRSLARARRSLAGLAGGGPTPLAAGLDAAHALARDARRRGRTPLIVVMTDGRANVARDGTTGGDAPMEDSLTSARAIAAERVPTLFLDTAPRPKPRAEALARAMAARYLPLPYLDASGISQQVQALAGP